MMLFWQVGKFFFDFTVIKCCSCVLSIELIKNFSFFVCFWNVAFHLLFGRILFLQGRFSCSSLLSPCSSLLLYALVCCFLFLPKIIIDKYEGNEGTEIEKTYRRHNESHRPIFHGFLH